MKGLTRRQQEVLDFIEEYVGIHGFPPSVRNIASHLSLVSASGVHKHIKALVRKKALSKQEFTSRSLRVLKRGTASAGAADISTWRVSGMLSPRGIRAAAGGHPSVLRLSSAWVGKHPPGQVLLVENDAFAAQGIRANDALLVSKASATEGAELLLIQSNGGYALAPDEDVKHQPNAQVYGVVVGLWRSYRHRRPAAAAH